MQIDIDAVTRILEEAAASEVMPRFRALQDHEITEKGSGELVTVADVATEKFVSARLRDLLPGSLVVGEEGVDADPGLLDHLSGDMPVWIIDPIDGTGNFAGGRPTFAVMVALVRGGETLAAWIHDPINGRTATAEAGAGAWMAGARLQVAPGDHPAAMRGTLHASSFAPPDMAAQVQARRGQVGAIKSLRCAGWEYLRMVAGEMHFSLFTRLMPWDHVPGVLIHREAGGTGLCLDGTAYHAARYREHGLLMAPNPDAWQTLKDTLFG